MFWPEAAATLAVVRPRSRRAQHLVGGVEDPLRGVGRRPARAARAGLRSARRAAQAGAPAALGSMPIAASFFDSERIAYSNISEEW